MKKVLALIENKKQDFARLPFFEYLQDRSINPRQRLAFAPCMAPFVMAFGELNGNIFRDEPTKDPIQAIINKHTYEDENHWIWLLEDLEKLEIDRSVNFTDTLRFVWSEETKISRRVAYELYRYTFQASSVQKLVVIEAAEATGNAFLSVSSQIISELKTVTNKEYRYFGGGHLIVDTGHTYCAPKAKNLIETIELTEEDRKKYFHLVENIFELFTEFTHELLTYSKAHNIYEPLRTKPEQKELVEISAL